MMVDRAGAFDRQSDCRRWCSDPWVGFGFRTATRVDQLFAGDDVGVETGFSTQHGKWQAADGAIAHCPGILQRCW